MVYQSLRFLGFPSDRGFKLPVNWLAQVWILFVLLFMGYEPLQGQSYPLSRPILFVHGFCGDAGSWANLAQALSASVAQDHSALYPYIDTSTSQQKIYQVYYDSIADQVFFIDPDTGSKVSESWILPSTRFFEIAFYDSANASFDPTDVANISILNKAYELSRVIKEITTITRIKDVIVVAHSMGGLVARAYMENLGSSGYCWDPGTPSVPDYSTSTCQPGKAPAAYGSDIADLITIDTPHGGTNAASLNTPIQTVCALDPSASKTEMLPGSSLLQTLNFYGDPNEQLPSATVPTVAVQSIESYFSNEPNPGSIMCPDAPTDNTGLTYYCDDLINSNHQAIRQNIESTHLSQLSNWTDIGNPFSDQDVGITKDTECYIGYNAQTNSGLRMLHLIECLGNQQQTQGDVYSRIDPIVSGQLTSIAVNATYNGQPWSGSLSFSILFQDYSSTDETSIPVTVTGVPVGTYSIPTYDISGGPPSAGPPTVTASPSPTIQAGQWATTFTIAFADKTSTTTTVTASPAQVTQGASVILTASVHASSGTPTGEITFYDGSSAISSPVALNNLGLASIGIATFTAGSHSVTAKYSGDNTFTASTSSAVTVTVGGASPHISVTPSAGTLGVTSFTKSGTGFTPYGPITHTATWPDNTKNVLNGYADSTGSFSYPVTYSGEVGTYYQTDTDNTTGQPSNTISWNVSSVVANDFNLSATPTSLTISQGSSVAFNVLTSTTSGSAQSVNLSVVNAPSGLTTSFSPTSVTSGNQSTLTLNVTSSAPTATYAITVVGTGASTTHTCQLSLTVVQAATGPLVTLNPSIVRFNDQAVGSVSSLQTVLLMNSGTGQLIVSGIGLASGNSDYTLNLSQTSFPLILNQGVPHDIQVSFDPTTTGTRSGQIIVYDNAPGSPHTVTLTGNGTAALPTTGTINVSATLNGIALPSSYGYQYSLVGPASYTGYDGYSFVVSPGSYTIAFTSSPTYLTLSSVTPSATQSVSAGGSVNFTLNFTAPDDFYGPTFGAPAGAVTPQVVSAGATATYYFDVTAAPGSASSPITLSIAGTPENSTAVFTPQPTYSGAGGTLTVGTTAGLTPPGVYALTVSGTNINGVTHVGAATSLVVTTPPVSPVKLVSESSTGAEGNALSSVGTNSVSADGRFVAFSSTATNFASGAPTGISQIYVRDLQALTTTPVSVSNTGALADSSCYYGRMSANGQFVVFYSFADNLYAGSALNSASGVYVRDLIHGVTEREDVTSSGTPANGASLGGVISADGRFVAFISTATNLVSGASGAQVYLRDRNTGDTVLVSAATDGSASNAGSSSVSISADGRFVAFVSDATNLVAQNTNGLSEVFIRDVQAGETSLVSISSSGVPANAYVFDDTGDAPPALSADGRYVAFVSQATNLVPQVTIGTAFHVYQYDRQLQQNTLVDVDSVATPLGGWSDFIDQASSADGRFIAFYGFEQVLVRDVVANRTAVVSLAPNGTAGDNTTFFGGWELSLGGPEVTFTSLATNLLSSSVSGQGDTYAASNPFMGSSYLQSLILTSPSTSGGSAVTGTITLNGPAPAGGATVAVWSNNDAAQPPAVVVVPAGATTAPISFSTSLVPSETVMTILASYNGGSGVVVLTLEPAAILSVSPSTYDFGNQAISTSSPAQSFTLTDSGSAPLALGSITLSTGTVFAISANNCQSSLAPGASCSLTVTFTPTSEGSTSDTLQVTSGSPATTQPIQLSGFGAAPSVSLSPGTVSFGNIPMPGSAPQTASLSNTGNANLSNITATISGTNIGDFALSDDGCSGTILPPNSTCSVTVTFSPKAKGSRTAFLSIADSASASPQTSTLSGIGVQSTPTIVWTPSATSGTYGVALGLGALNATANFNGTSLTGTFAYSASANGGSSEPVTASSVLGGGSYIITATFTPSDGTDYTTATLTAQFTVNKASLTVTANNQSMTYGGALPTLTGALSGVVAGDGITASYATIANASSAVGTYPITVTLNDPNGKLGNYSVTNTPGTLTVTKAPLTVTANNQSMAYEGTVPTLTGTVTGVVAGDGITATYTTTATSSSPAGTYPITAALNDPSSKLGNYSVTNTPGTLTISKVTPSIAWATPAAITYGTALSGTQLNATASIQGTFSYSPALGAVLRAGSDTLTATFTPNDTTDYGTVTASVMLTVNQATPTVTWATPAAITYPTALSATQLDATASIQGTFTYNPVSGTVPSVGVDTLSVSFTPNDSTDYTAASGSVKLNVNNPVPVINGLSPGFTSADGTAFTLTVNGVAFMPNSTISWGSTALTTQYVSATQLTAQVPANDIAGSGAATVTVQTPTPGGGTSNSFSFEIDSAGTTSPTFTTVTATVTPGASATYPVTLPSSATNVSASCPNPPPGVACSYSSTTNAVTITTTSATPAGTYQIVVVFTETLPGAASALVLFPILLLPLLTARKRWTAGRIWYSACLGFILLAAAASSIGCGGGNGSGSTTQPQTHQVTSSGTVTLTIQ